VAEISGMARRRNHASKSISEKSANRARQCRFHEAPFDS